MSTKEERKEAIRRFTEWDEERCARQSDKVERLIEAMREGVVCFRYVKCDGTIRSAAGTLRVDMFDKVPEGKRVVPVANVPYWDVEKSQFRSFNAWALL